MFIPLSIHFLIVFVAIALPFFLVNRIIKKIVNKYLEVPDHNDNRKKAVYWIKIFINLLFLHFIFSLSIGFLVADDYLLRIAPSALLCFQGCSVISLIFSILPSSLAFSLVISPIVVLLLFSWNKLSAAVKKTLIISTVLIFILTLGIFIYNDLSKYQKVKNERIAVREFIRTLSKIEGVGDPFINEIGFAGFASAYYEMPYDPDENSNAIEVFKSKIDKNKWQMINEDLKENPKWAYFSEEQRKKANDQGRFWSEIPFYKYIAIYKKSDKNIWIKMVVSYDMFHSGLTISASDKF